MFRLMKSQKCILGTISSRTTVSYRQLEIAHFIQFSTALRACKTANISGISHHYILNDSGQEYFNDTWID